ncbi:MAG: hypothetical protein M3140_06290 [Actinomycetota bacterium]|nr:hypothetical protein [Actinomycetota bacterium]
MPKRLKGATFARLAVGAAVLAFPLLATGVAQASIAGAPPSTATQLPNPTYSIAQSSDQVGVCFDVSLANSGLVGSNFSLAGYRAGNSGGKDTGTAAALDPTDPRCVLVTFGNLDANVDINRFTVVEMTANAVHKNTNGQGNLQDSVTLTPNLSTTDACANTCGPLSKDGTTGNSAAPNLSGITGPPTNVQQTANQLTFTFDRDIATTPAPVPASFFIITPSGDVCRGTTVSAPSGNTLTVTFSKTTAPASFTGAKCTSADTVVTAIRGGVLQNAVFAAYDHSAGSYPQTTVLSNCASPCATQRPYLVSATLNPANYDEIVYTFNTVVGTPVPADFLAELSNGKTVTAMQAQPTGGNTVDVTFKGSLTTQAEYAVNAYATFGAVLDVTSSAPAGLSIPGSAPIGDNAGGQAPGFTTAADVNSVNFSTSGGTATVLLDQRVASVDTSKINLVSSTGAISNVGTAAFPGASSSFGAAAPGPETVTLFYNKTALTNVTGVQFLPGAFTSTLGAAQTITTDNKSVAQVVTAVQGASILRAIKAHHKHHKHHKHHRHNKKH